jgi:hypothetical protein
MVVVGLVVYALVLHPSRPQDDRSYRAGYDQLGPHALGMVNAGYSPSASCNSQLRGQLAFEDNRSIPPDPVKELQGCLDYLQQHGYP